MSTPVKGPGDVKAGDVVEVDVGNSFRSSYVIATVTKVNATRLTVKRADTGASLSKAYSRVRSTAYAFHRLDAHDRWRRTEPKCHDFVRVGHVPHASFSLAAIRDRPENVKAQIDALSAWLKAEPEKDAP